MSLVHEPLAREEESLDVEVVIRQVNIAANKVHNLSTELQKVTEELGRATVDGEGEITFGPEVRWSMAVEQRVIEIVDEYEKQGKRPPAEDIRTARAKRHVREHDPELFVTYMQLLTRQKALRMTISSEKEVISGKQSVLNGLRAAGA